MAPDPHHVTWRARSPANAPIARSSHGASVINNTLYVFGGEHVARTPIDSVVHALDLTDPNAAFVAIDGGANAPPPRVGHAQASIENVFYVFGGRRGVEMNESPLNDLWAFDVESREWTDLSGGAGDVPCPRSFHVATAARGKLYVFGGCGPADAGRLADLHEYDVASKTWTKLPGSDAIESRGGAGFSSTTDGSTLVIAGGFAGREMNDIHAYDIASKTWRAVAGAPGAPPPTATKLRDADHERPAPAPLRPRSVWPVMAFTCYGDHVIGFGGEVDPSERGHDGAGGFANDVVAIEVRTGDAKTLPLGRGGLGAGVGGGDGEEETAVPAPRGWTAAAEWRREGAIVLFGGLSGSDAAPERLGDVQIGYVDRGGLLV